MEISLDSVKVENWNTFDSTKADPPILEMDFTVGYPSNYILDTSDEDKINLVKFSGKHNGTSMFAILSVSSMLNMQNVTSPGHENQVKKQLTGMLDGFAKILEITLGNIDVLEH
ncbi:MAG: hypothetical protein LBQ79_03710 [Deltaproteobacteria bacterium]|nr:hypothetical protein [Deltaproteobacteria bacterium]